MHPDTIEFVRHLDQTIGIIIRAQHRAEGIEFYTPNIFSQQLAYMNRPQGYAIHPHVHNPVKRDVIWTQEVLLIRSGKIRVDFFTDGKHYLESRILEKGDVILLAAGGHGFEMLEPTEMIEIKQGPYCGDQDKTRFDPLPESQIRIQA
jgi:hypothetical protein